MISSNAVEIRDLSFSYRQMPVLQNINLIVKPLDFFAIIGPNGGGKTTLLKLILGLLKADNGTIEVLGYPPEKIHNRIGYLPQAGEYNKDIPLRVCEVVMMSSLKFASLLPWYSEKNRKKAMQILEQLQISNLAQRLMNELSGGQRQRALIARALMTDPEILILDEPTASVDVTMEKDIYETLRLLNKDKTIIIVSHDISFVSAYVNRVTCLNVEAVTHDISEIQSANLTQSVYNNNIKAIKHTCKL